MPIGKEVRPGFSYNVQRKMNFSVILRHTVQRREHGMLECQCTKADSYHFIARKFFLFVCFFPVRIYTFQILTKWG